jgi:hypothetical protein
VLSGVGSAEQSRQCPKPYETDGTGCLSTPIPRLRPVDSHAHLYALAGALSVQTAELLKATHRVVGVPAPLEDLPPRRRGFLNAALKTYGAAAASSALTSRLLLMQRDLTSRMLGNLPLLKDEFGAPEEAPAAALRKTVRALAMTHADIGAARIAWEETSDDLAADAIAALDTLARYLDDVVDVLERYQTPAEG